MEGGRGRQIPARFDTRRFIMEITGADRFNRSAPVSFWSLIPFTFGVQLPAMTNPVWNSWARSRFLCVFYSALFFAAGARAQMAPWPSIGPYGGDARSFAADSGEPGHLFLGDTNNWVFESKDGGASWKRLGKVDGSDDLIVDSLIVDSSNSKTLFAGVWRVDRPDGGLYVSRDGGKTWQAVAALRGQSIRSLAQAPSDPNILIAGSLDGVFRSEDHGATWTRISPAAGEPLSREIHEVESLAIDPRKPEVVYAGTWHLPWKTTDGGAHWHNIKQGVIDDSDVFSIIVDPQKPSVVYASACSGIYKSENGGELFHKIQGIPATARRTRVLMQDTRHREVVYAGTTEGLYRTRDAGRVWEPLTGSDVIVNDIYLDPEHEGRLLLATDRGGVLASDDGGASFHGSNQGFSARKIEALVVERDNPDHILAGVVNDKTYGGVFETNDGGGSWSQIADGLDGRDVFTLAEAGTGEILAGTSHGIFVLAHDDGFPTPHWVMRSSIVNHATKVVATEVKGRRVNREESYTLPARQMSSRVLAFDLSGDVWIVATQEGLFTSVDKGASWQGGLVLGSAQYHAVLAFGGKLLAARPQGVIASADKGKNWTPMRLPQRIKDIHALAYSPDGTLWIGSGDGVYFSHDGGNNWFWLEKVPVRDVDDLSYDPGSGRMMATSRMSQVLYAVDPASLAFTGTWTGFRIFRARPAGKTRIAASIQDGVVVDPGHP